ncbi:hypothetical protein [uncultured Corynebacterium sp.]|nr:hypothetical protein [uncultured Corynebacterium sp.]
MSFPLTAPRTGAPATPRALPASQGHLAGWTRGQIAHGVDTTV